MQRIMKNHNKNKLRLINETRLYTRTTWISDIVEIETGKINIKIWKCNQIKSNQKWPKSATISKKMKTLWQIALQRALSPQWANLPRTTDIRLVNPTMSNNMWYWDQYTQSLMFKHNNTKWELWHSPQKNKILSRPHTIA